MEEKYLTVREIKRCGQSYFDDCAELFLITALDNFNNYFGFELNLKKASNDFIFFNDFYNGKDLGFKGFNPEFEVVVTYQGTINDIHEIDSGWTMEMAIPIANFEKFTKVVLIRTGYRWAFMAVRHNGYDVAENLRSISTISPYMIS